MTDPSTNDAPLVQTTFAAGTRVPHGFAFSGLRCGIKQSRPDLGLVLSSPPAVAAGVFTRNPVRAACAARNATLVPSPGIAAVIVNSGNANAMTGAPGVRANEVMAEELAKLLGAAPEAVLTGSTGVIGSPLPVDLVAESLDDLVAAAAPDPRAFAEAILTTDTVAKLAHVEIVLPGDATPVRLLGVAKGSGMIHPDMATTMGFVCTDAAIAPALLQELLKAAIMPTFNAITVDGDTSTNDMVVVLANGASKVHVEGDARVAAFAAALQAVLLALAKHVARDGEGATRLLEVEVTGAPEVASARAVARTIARSSLVKCTIFAAQAQWGRVAMAIGQAALEHGIALKPELLRISAQGVVLHDGSGPRSEVKPPELKRRLRESEVRWSVDLGLGDAAFVAYGCDLTYDYVRINADEAQSIEVGPTGRIARNLTLAAYSPRLKQQLLVEGLGYVRRFTGLKLMVYLQPTAAAGDAIAGLAQDLELCLDAGLKPLVVVPDQESARLLDEHMRRTGHFAGIVAPDPMGISHLLDRGHMCILVREAPVPDAIVDLSLKVGIQKLVVLGTEQGLRDAHGFVQRLSPETLLTGLDRGRFDESDPDLLVLARHAATRGVPALHLLDARMPHAVVGELFTDQGVGTLVTRQATP
ncbi:MAG TPA: bifunctional glutamate N-acetyltransferase/amino-acid acetyltransferase ArgJ [Nannocystaceae bacterium]|nr:bifunctional glutamate N-acetyltransferase/amino-acid acetyltransferase ArgJ [Nannocystaceae bacterium]